MGKQWQTHKPGAGDDQAPPRPKEVTPEQRASDAAALAAELAAPLPGADPDWSRRSWREAQAAGLTKSTLCADGWYVPNVEIRKPDQRDQR